MNQFPDNTAMILIIFFFVAIFFLCYGIARYFQSRLAQQRILRRIHNDGYSGQTVDADKALPEKKSLSRKFLNFFSYIGKMTMSGKKLDEFSGKRIKFLKAGIRWKHAPSAFWGAKCFLGLFFPFVFLMLRLFLWIKTMNVNMATFFFFVSALLGFYLPDIWLLQVTEKRKEKLIKSIPDAMDLLVICVEAGMGIDNAFNRVANEIRLSHPLLSDEFVQMNLEMRAGSERKEALKNLAKRTDLEELSSLTGLLIQTDKFGTSVSSALKIFSEGLKEKRFQRAEEMAAKTPVKMVLPLILFILPALFVVILGPAAIKIYQTIILK